MEDEMLTHYFTDPRALHRLRTAPHGPTLEGFAAHLARCGYAAVTAQSHVRAAGYLCRWLVQNSIHVRTLDEALLDRFLEARPIWGGGRPHVRVPAGVARFLAYLRCEGTAKNVRPLKIPVLIEGFERWMRLHRGVTVGTLEVYRGLLLEFLEVVGDDPSRYDAAGIRSFVFQLSGRTGRSYTQLGVTAVRMFLRFLSVSGHCAPELADAPPKMAHWKQAHLPARISRDDVERLIDACRPSTAYGRRDRAMLLLMARLGLRSSDVAGLRLQDIDWRTGRLMVRGKGRRRSALPLPQDVGDAVRSYLTESRPDRRCDAVFLTFRSPCRPLHASSVGAMVARLAKKASVELPRAGSHVLRHTLASSLLSDGMTLQGISVLLRHTSLDAI
jgi:integrase/recombinase XerD